MTPQPVAATADDLRRLTPYAVEFRYDDEAPHLLIAGQAAAIVDALLAWATIHIDDQDA